MTSPYAPFKTKQEALEYAAHYAVVYEESILDANGVHSSMSDTKIREAWNNSTRFSEPDEFDEDTVNSLIISKARVLALKKLEKNLKKSNRGER